MWVFICMCVCTHRQDAHLCVQWGCQRLTSVIFLYCSLPQKISHGTSSPVVLDYLTKKSLGSTRVAPNPAPSIGVTDSMLAFMWVLRAQAFVLKNVQQTLYPWSQLPSPKYSCFVRTILSLKFIPKVLAQELKKNKTMKLLIRIICMTKSQGDDTNVHCHSN